MIKIKSKVTGLKQSKIYINKEERNLVVISKTN
jgi:hypothetical protein